MTAGYLEQPFAQHLHEITEGPRHNHYKHESLLLTSGLRKRVDVVALDSGEEGFDGRTIVPIRAVHDDLNAELLHQLPGQLVLVVTCTVPDDGGV